MPKVAGKKTRRTKTTPYVAEHLRTKDEMAAYLEAWLDEAPDDAAGIVRALGDIACAKGKNHVATNTGRDRGPTRRS